MNNPVDNKKTGLLCKLSGEISHYQCTRASANFVFTENDRQKLGVIAIGAALAGMGAQAASATASASAMEEQADYIEFTLNGDLVKGWVWRSPFWEGDTVDVAAQWQGDHYEAYGVARPSDKMVALYPHCSRALGRHIKNAVKWWFIWNGVYFGFTVALVFCLGMPDLLSEPGFFWMNGAVAACFVLMFLSLSKQYLPFVHLSERVFLTLGLPSARDIDLVKSSKEQRTAEDSGEFGTFYFRY